MTAKELKASILDRAIRGALVPQDPHDEPASALVARIRKERAAASARHGGRARRPATAAPPPIPDDEKPFDIPKSWQWVRLGEVSEVQLGKMLDRAKNKGKPFPYLANASVRWNDFDLANLKQMPFTDEDIPKFSLRRGDILMCEGGVPGRCAIWQLDDSPIKYQKAVHRIRVQHWLPEFCCLYFAAIQGSRFFASFFTGTTIKHLPRERLLKIPIPLPPLAEQGRIVAKVEALMPLVAKYGELEERRRSLDAALPGALEKSILQEAIRGALVPQDPRDEPASALVARIRKKRAAASARHGGRARRSATAAPLAIPDDEKPFDIPQNWQWVRLGEVSEVQLGKMLDRAKNKGKPFPYLANASVRWNDFDLANLKQMPFTDEDIPKFSLRRGDILMCEGGVPGRCAIWQLDDSPIKYQKAVHRIRVQHWLPEFCCLYFAAIQGSRFFASFFTGTTIKHLPRERLLKIPIPLPPLAEQGRIVAKVEALRAALARL